MFSVRQKREIADAVQKILRSTNHPELPAGEIQFSLHVAGSSAFSWADIRNNGAVTDPGVNPWNEQQDPRSAESEATQTSEEAAANARLISKSPDLFALACGVVADSDEASVHDPRYRQACDLVQEITYCGDSQVYDRAVKHLESEATS